MLLEADHVEVGNQYIAVRLGQLKGTRARCCANSRVSSFRQKIVKALLKEGSGQGDRGNESRSSPEVPLRECPPRAGLETALEF